MKFRILKRKHANHAYVIALEIDLDWFSNTYTLFSSIEETLDDFEDSYVENYNLFISMDNYIIIHEFNNLLQFKDEYPEYFI